MSADLYNSEQMGPSSHFWRLQPGRSGMLCHLLLPLPDSGGETAEVRYSVSGLLALTITYLLPLSSPPPSRMDSKTARSFHDSIRAL